MNLDILYIERAKRKVESGQFDSIADAVNHERMADNKNLTTFLKKADPMIYVDDRMIRYSDIHTWWVK